MSQNNPVGSSSIVLLPLDEINHPLCRGVQLSTFGVMAYIYSSTLSYFVGEEDALWDWLLADNGVPIGLPDMQLVPSPPGYKFLRNGGVNGEDQSEPEGLMVYSKSPRDEKAWKLLPVLTSVEETEFEALNIDESRIMQFLV